MAQLSDQIVTEIRAEMGRQRINSGELARRLGRSYSYVSRRLTGAARLEVDDLEEMAGVLGVPVSQFLPDEVTAA